MTRVLIAYGTVEGHVAVIVSGPIRAGHHQKELVAASAERAAVA